MSNTMIFGLKTYAPSPVWSGSIAGPVRFQPLTKREAARRYHQARRFERQTRTPGRQDGALGRNGLAILHAFLFDFLNYRSGRLDPGYRAIAYAAAISIRSVARGLQKLKAAGVLHWLRRCSATVDEDGRYSLRQEFERLFGQPDITMERLPRGAAACCSRMGRSALRREGALDRGARGAAGRRQRRGDAQRPCRGWRRRWPGRGAAEARAGGVLSVCHIGEETRTSFRFS